LRSPNLSLANGVGFAISACFFHSLLDDLPHRQSLATRFVRPLGFVLIISSFLGFFPFLTGMATVQWTSLQELRYLCQSIAFCVTFVKVGLVGAQILGSRARRSDEGGTPARKPPEYVGV
jgi:hypothetical protein